MEYIKKMNIPLIAFAILSLRSLYAFDFAQAAAFVCVSAVYGLHLYIDSKKALPLDDEVRRELDAMKNTVTNLSVRSGVKPIETNKKSYF